MIEEAKELEARGNGAQRPACWKERAALQDLRVYKITAVWAA